MKNHEHKRFAFSVASAVGITYLLCAVLIKVFPKHSLRAIADVLHLSSLEPLTSVINVSPLHVVCGLITVFVLTFFVAWLTGHILCLFYKDQK